MSAVNNIGNNICLICLWTLIMSLSFILSDSSDRKIDISKNPNCKTCNESGISIIYVKASSSSDVLHYIFAAGKFTEALSVIIIKSTNVHSEVSFNYTNLVNGLNSSIVHISDNNYTAFGLVFTKLFTTSNDEPVMEKWNQQEITVRDFDNFVWRSHVVGNTIKFSTNETKFKNDSLFSRGNIVIQFNVSGSSERSKGMPRLQFTGNNTQIDFILNNLNVSSLIIARFGVEIALINKFNLGEMIVKEDKSIDDEYSPGVFRIKTFYGQSNLKLKSDQQTYLQWKPVCYLNAVDHHLNQLSVTQNTDSHRLSKSPNVENIVRSSLVYKFFGESIFWPNSSTSIVNASFGIANDKGYNAANYLIWTLSFGVGQPPFDSISDKVILVISLGLGLPFVMVVVGSIYLIIKKRLSRRMSYDTIEDPIN